MAWFTSIKGIAPSLSSIDKTAPASLDAATAPIVRGAVIILKSDTGEFISAPASMATDASARVYWAQTGSEDSQGGFAGSVGFGSAGINDAKVIEAGVPTEVLLYPNGSVPAGIPGHGVVPGIAVINGISVLQPGEYQTDQFDITEDYAVGTLLTYGAGTQGDGSRGTAVTGLLVPHTAGDNVVGRVTAAPFTRFINNAPVKNSHGRKTGSLQDVINFEALWIPTYTAVVADAVDGGGDEGGNG